MGHIAPEKVANYDFTKDGKPLEYVWEANTDEGWVDLVCTDRQGNLLPNPQMLPGTLPDCPYELVRVKGKIDATPTSRKIPSEETSAPHTPTVSSDGDQVTINGCRDPDCPFCRGLGDILHLQTTGIFQVQIDPMVVDGEWIQTTMILRDSQGAVMKFWIWDDIKKRHLHTPENLSCETTPESS